MVWAPGTANCLQTTCNDYSRADGFNMIVHGIGRNNDQEFVRVFDKLSFCHYGSGQQGSTLCARDYKGPTDLVVTANTANCLRAQAQSSHRLDSDNFVFAYSFAQNSRNELRLTGGDGQTVGCLNTSNSAKPGQGVPAITFCQSFRAAGQDGFNPTNVTPPTIFYNEFNYGWSVRRLTEIECERLQGFPDNHTQIEWRAKPTNLCPAGPRYKALGNSKAVPVARWIGERIDLAFKAVAQLNQSTIDSSQNPLHHMAQSKKPTLATAVSSNCEVPSFTGYLGAKNGAGVFQTIINLIPPCDTFIELFAGTAAIYRNMAKADKTILVDKNIDCLGKFAASDQLELLNVCGLDWLEQNLESFGKNVVIYCDPPYHPNTRSSDSRYQFEFTADDHERLLRLANKSGSYVLISGYRNDTCGKPIELYQSELDDNSWWSLDYPAMSRGGPRTETVWCNYQPSDVLHDYGHFGANKAQRQASKRKVVSMANKFASMNKAEQLAVLAAMAGLVPSS